jgi:hypothetical protein
VKTETTQTEKKSKVWQAVSNIGVIVALTLGVIQVIEWRNNRTPKLHLFVPEYYTGTDVGANKRFLAVLVRISNFTQKNAYLFPETMAVKVKSKGKWYRTEIKWIPKEYIETDFTEYEKVLHGTSEVKLLKRFESPVIAYDNPLTRFIVLSCEDTSLLENIDGIKIYVEDCHQIPHIMSVENLEEQRKRHHPYYQFDKF